MLVNNAGNDDRHRSEDVTVEYWDERMAVNLRHQFFAAQAVRPQMRDAGGGSIINFGSITWLVGDGDCPAYVTAKASITGLTRALAREFGPENIRVNCMLPGWVMTERQMRLWLTPEGERQIDDRQCLKGPAPAARHRPHGAVPGGRRQPDVQLAEFHRRRRLGLTPPRQGEERSCVWSNIAMKTARRKVGLVTEDGNHLRPIRGASTVYELAERGDRTGRAVSPSWPRSRPAPSRSTIWPC